MLGFLRPILAPKGFGPAGAISFEGLLGMCWLLLTFIHTL